MARPDLPCDPAEEKEEVIVSSVSNSDPNRGFVYHAVAQSANKHVDPAVEAEWTRRQRVRAEISELQAQVAHPLTKRQEVVMREEKRKKLLQAEKERAQKRMREAKAKKAKMRAEAEADVEVEEVVDPLVAKQKEREMKRQRWKLEDEMRRATPADASPFLDELSDDVLASLGHLAQCLFPHCPAATPTEESRVPLRHYREFHSEVCHSVRTLLRLSFQRFCR